MLNQRVWAASVAALVLAGCGWGEPKPLTPEENRARMREVLERSAPGKGKPSHPAPAPEAPPPPR